MCVCPVYMSLIILRVSVFTNYTIIGIFVYVHVYVYSYVFWEMFV